jgi:hypothetical protein
VPVQKPGWFRLSCLRILDTCALICKFDVDASAHVCQY